MPRRPSRARRRPIGAASQASRAAAAGRRRRAAAPPRRRGRAAARAQRPGHRAAAGLPQQQQRHDAAGPIPPSHPAGRSPVSRRDKTVSRQNAGRYGQTAQGARPVAQDGEADEAGEQQVERDRRLAGPEGRDRQGIERMRAGPSPPMHPHRAGRRRGWSGRPRRRCPGRAPGHGEIGRQPGRQAKAQHGQQAKMNSRGEQAKAAAGSGRANRLVCQRDRIAMHRTGRSELSSSPWHAGRRGRIRSSSDRAADGSPAGPGRGGVGRPARRRLSGPPS